MIFIIKHISFNHGWFYHYRVHRQKLNELGGDFSGLRIYLKSMFENCPHDYFEAGPRSSHLRFNLNLDVKEITGHEVNLLTKIGLKENRGRFTTDHSKVQMFMLENDDKTIAVEIPIWLEPDEMKGYDGLFNSDEPLTGHIDLLRIENGKIWIWDYKPNAKNENYAVTQTYFYALMLSKRIGISLDKFRCGYFDGEYAYVFKPEEHIFNYKQKKLGV